MNTASPVPLAAVFFDLDGTLIESEEVWNDAIRMLTASRATVADDALLARTHGLDAVEAIDLVHRELRWRGYDVGADAEWVERRVADAFRRGVTWRPDVRMLLAQVRAAGIPTALVTSTRRYLVDIILDILGTDSFDAVVCGDEVRLPKPDPEPYLTAARLLGVDTGACVAVEDSIIGATSARSSGCAVLLVGALNSLSDSYLQPDGADIDPASLGHLVRWLAG